MADETHGTCYFHDTEDGEPGELAPRRHTPAGIKKAGLNLFDKVFARATRACADLKIATMTIYGDGVEDEDAIIDRIDNGVNEPTELSDEDIAWMNGTTLVVYPMLVNDDTVELDEPIGYTTIGGNVGIKANMANIGRLQYGSNSGYHVSYRNSGRKPVCISRVQRRLATRKQPSAA